MSTFRLVLALSAAALLACGGDDKKPAVDPSTSSSSSSSSGGADHADAGSASTSSSSSSSSSSGGAASADAGGASTPPAPAQASFDSLPKDKKTEIMMTKVVPNVGKLFKEHDAKKFGKFGCATCHGSAKEKTKDDPKKILPKLKLSGDGFEKMSKGKDAAMMKFMAEKVVPAMAEALGEKPFDPATHQGFGCGGCHTVE